MTAPAFPRFAVACGEEASDPWVLHDGALVRVDQLAASRHLEHQDDDLAAVAGLGVRVWRYGIPWRLTEVAPGAYDWTLWDRALAACERHGLQPVVDLCHFGLPDHYPGFCDPAWVEGFARYVEAFLARYPDPVWFTPVNEPGITATFSARWGIWNDRRTDAASHAAALAHVTLAGLEALSRIWADRDAWWIGAEGFGCQLADPDDEAGVVAARRAQELEWAVWDLHLGLEPVGAGAELVAHVPDPVRARLAQLAAHLRRDRVVAGHDVYPVSVTPHGTRAERPLTIDDRIAAYGATARAWHDRYQLPFWVAETSNLSLPVEDGPAWLGRLVDELDAMAHEGLPVRGICWYSRGDQRDWDTALVEPVGRVTTVGLFDAERRPRPVAADYERLARSR